MCLLCLERFTRFLKQLQEELSFTTGQIINVYGEMDDDGFYLGEIDGQRGLVPSNFLAEVTDQYNQSNQQGQQGGGAMMGRGQRGRGHGPGARGPPPPPRDNRMPQRKTGNTRAYLLYSIGWIDVNYFRTITRFFLSVCFLV